MPEFIHFCHNNFAYSNFEHNHHAPKSEFICKIHQQVQPEKNFFPHQMSLLRLISVSTHQILFLFAHGV